jgi:hypothetical protein
VIKENEKAILIQCQSERHRNNVKELFVKGTITIKTAPALQISRSTITRSIQQGWVEIMPVVWF